jgi:hypothetical protein
MKIKINDRSVEVERRAYDRDVVTAKHTAFATFNDLVNAPHYRPSIYLGGKKPKEQRELLFLAHQYNSFQHARHDGRRVYKGDWRPVFRKEHPLLAVDIPSCECPDCTDLAIGSAPVSLNGHPKRVVYVCQRHKDAAAEDVPACVHDTDGDGNCPIHPKGCPKCEAEIDAIMPTINESR